MRLQIFAWTLAAALAATPAFAAKKAGVELPDTHTVDGKSLVLNGLGLREATIFRVDVYVAGLYLPKKTSDVSEILDPQTPKHLEMHFVRDVGKDSITDAWSEGFEKNAKDFAALKAKVEKLNSWMGDIKDGEVMALTYVPGQGSTVYLKGQKKGTIEGEDFQRAMFRIYVGPNPPNSGLKEGLLGN